MKTLSYLSMFALLLGFTVACGDDDDTNTPDGMVQPEGGTPDGDAGDQPDGDASMMDGFDFRTDAPTAYTQVDRNGMPAISTALVFDTNGDMMMRKQAYNEGTPTQDGALAFAGDLLNGLGTLHAVLDDDLMRLGLTPCEGTATAPDLPGCVTQEVGGVQALSLIVPDMLTVNPMEDAAMAAFPNGRRLDEKVVDIELAIILLDLGMAPNGAAQLIDLTQGTDTDVAFLDAFPYVGAPHN